MTSVYKHKLLFLALSECLATVFIGIFYIYTAISLSKHMGMQFNESVTNNIDDIVMVNNVYEVYNISNINNSSTTTMLPELNDSDVAITTENTMDVTETVIEETEDTNLLYQENIVETTTKVNKNSEFLEHYQNLLKNILRQKLNNTRFNQTFFHQMMNPPVTRTKRQFHIEMEMDTCFEEKFLENALFLYSFVHCLISLLNNTLYCKDCVGKTNETETKVESSNDDSNSEKNETSAPVGPLFDEKDSTKQDHNEPKVELFQAKKATVVKQKVTDKNEPTDVPSFTPERIKLPLQISMSWIVPVFAVLVLYLAISKETAMDHYPEANIPNLNTTRADPNIANLLQNITSDNKNRTTEIDKVIKNVYNIVNEVHAKVTNKTTYIAPLTVDIVYFLNQRKRDPKQVRRECNIQETSVKFYFLLVFVVAFFLVILYAKIIQVLVKPYNMQTARQLDICLAVFSILWLPSVLDIVFRTYLDSSKSAVLSDIFLSLGNMNVLYTMAANYFKCKQYIGKNNNTINPKV